MTPSVYIGYDHREHEAYEVAKHSICRRSNVSVAPLRLDELTDLLIRPIENREGKLWCPVSQAPMATEFAISRFCVPFLRKHGWALFVDSDIVCLADIDELFDLADPKYAVMCVKHPQADTFDLTYDERCEIYDPVTRKERWRVHGASAKSTKPGDWSILEILVRGCPYDHDYRGVDVIEDCSLLPWSCWESENGYSYKIISADHQHIMDVSNMARDLVPETLEQRKADFLQFKKLIERDPFKMDRQLQTFYKRKNWSSVVLWNCEHPAHQRFTRWHLNTWPGRDLHAFKWLDDSEIGELPPNWNYLVDVNLRPDPIKIAHFTLGGPWFSDWKGGSRDDIWLAERQAMV